MYRNKNAILMGCKLGKKRKKRKRDRREVMDLDPAGEVN